MGEIREAALRALRRMGLTYLLADGQDTVVVPWPVGDQVSLVAIEPLEEAKEAMVWCEICQVPAPRRADIALLLARLNAERKFTVYSLKEERVILDVCAELSCVDDENGQEAMLALSLSRVLKALDDSYPVILSAVRGVRRSRSKAERQVANILRRCARGGGE